MDKIIEKYRNDITDCVASFVSSLEKITIQVYRDVANNQNFELNEDFEKKIRVHCCTLAEDLKEDILSGLTKETILENVESEKKA